MYILQECENKYGEKIWYDKVSNCDYSHICELCRLYGEKFPDKLYRVIEVFIYV